MGSLMSTLGCFEMSKRLAKEEIAQASLEYAGMIAAAGILIAAVITGAQGWGDTLACKISEAIGGGGCTGGRVDAMAPEKVSAEENSLHRSRQTGVSVPYRIAFVGGDFNTEGKAKETLYDNGDRSLMIESQVGFSANAGVGYDGKLPKVNKMGKALKKQVNPGRNPGILKWIIV